MSLMLQRNLLGQERNPAADGYNLDIVFEPGYAPQLTGHLLCQLAGGTHHQGLNPEALHIQIVQQANAKSCGLPASCLGLGQQVLPFKHMGQTLRLDRSHLLVSQDLQIFDHWFG